MLSINKLTIAVKDKIIIKDFSYLFEKGKIYAIMGPNGSGKSTLALALAGHPVYQIKSGKITLNNQYIQDLSPDKRSKAGLFLSFQSPLVLNGVSLFQMMRVALRGKISPIDLNNKIKHLSKELVIKEELVKRPLNEGASGGERKKLELLQGLILQPKVMIFDEIDTGVDVDSLKIIAKVMKKYQKNRTYIVITHYNRIFQYFKPDKVLILSKGVLKQTGGWELAQQIENTGYEKNSGK
ncbi:Fe-S cluster assembly ATPase SufC [Candidatus Roizmanbacteria bacterium CG2_30_33_16]|uniref:Fe-S cluster assembly ATPase SufC n=4 Tax=Candidatus Roizmaniibacteriota TaxID=1752723 RepID=A0A2H0C606_9BACT|nr:Fe-S cluster assembly ATPase SufC [Candidatus Roizmanbacteria bacterium]OIP83602.1 MAG: Fe-S cluster assembly ATPase SufC [Candidatus Roizmanbacteria bacterium CG2_30_33_16]PIP64748.1 MAG: Fe-S cluster assembly ATPase SufC [Candidatus Roizmanbacteria bacterium CG22_combo_CG10-13_8_21_14_all_33_16]PIX69692.1 MAG: Fe-S cluster assembly ATPase SufC [Candidatus Roizmanbacteria bacterium CG_4_10_14_3_um_filter_33_21]PJB87705.1 MAG: Fe-S cluster assembly ATPase SufC [Candidatus Roizmanbacteria bac